MFKVPSSPQSAKQDALQIEFNKGLCSFINNSPTPFHATAELAQHLDAANFIALDESEEWSLEAGKNYYVTRNQSSLIAWTQGSAPLVEQGMHMLGAHTDSPCLKVKPQADLYEHNSWRLGVEVYGGALLNPWFDRDLSLAGRVHYKNSEGQVAFAMVDFKCPIATIPSLAIHLDREANSKRSINPQTDLPVLLACGDKNQHKALNDLLMDQLNHCDSKPTNILEPASVVGINGDFIAASRLDNLLSCYVGLTSLIESAQQVKPSWSLLVCSDHEEVGSCSAVGAAGPFLQQTLQRLLPNTENFVRAMSRSVLISTDNAHALHPSHADKMDPNHSPNINGGPVIKVNANQRYASNSETQAMFRSICDDTQVPVQTFVVRSDMSCGSTIGPITAAELGVKTLDVGMPTYGMHSIRELAGSRDPLWLKTALVQFLARAGQ
jgi:aspartyl aminopeptidase